MKQVLIEKVAQRALRRMPANVATLIISKIKQYATDPDSLAANVTKLQARPGCRLRVGDWRVLFKEDARTVTITDIGPRGSVYD